MRWNVLGISLLALSPIASTAQTVTPSSAVERYGNWEVVRYNSGGDAPMCALAIRSAMARIALSPQGEGSLALAVTVTDGPRTPPADDAVIRVRGVGGAPVAEISLPVDAFHIRPSRPPVTQMSAVLRQPAAVEELLRIGRTHAELHLLLPQGPIFTLPESGFAEAWDAVKRCDPGRSAGMP